MKRRGGTTRSYGDAPYIARCCPTDSACCCCIGMPVVLYIVMLLLAAFPAAAVARVAYWSTGSGCPTSLPLPPRSGTPPAHIWHTKNGPRRLGPATRAQAPENTKNFRRSLRSPVRMREQPPQLLHTCLPTDHARAGTGEREELQEILAISGAHARAACPSRPRPPADRPRAWEGDLGALTPLTGALPWREP